ncbi:glutaredoxin family protein [Lacticaseibacillus paracasei]|uniref:glutaredoxin family protein n=1 Tax=Lacticaseibacillus paracasei TaxID=1597 RepID=UPI001F018BA5|nr:glutaredoxin family protein [Lacticaseibacillus paracasei]
MRSRNIAWIIWHDKLLSRFSTILPDSADTRQVLSAEDKRKREWSQHKVERLKAKYHIQQLPLVKIVDDEGNLIEYWSGFRPNKINQYAK